MIRISHTVRGGALVGVAALALAACSSSPSSSSSSSDSSSAGSTESASSGLVIGTILPQTGSLAFLGPPEIAGVNLAIKDINEAGGVLGMDVTAAHADSSDAEHAEIATQSVTDLLSKKVSVIIGAASSSVSLNIVDDIAAAKVVEISPANTSPKLSGYSPYYFRTAPPDSVQGSALGNLVLEDGYSNVGILVFNDDYGTGLRDVVKSTVEAAGGTITYGNTGQEFDPAGKSFGTEVTALLDTNPEAVVVISFEQIVQIVPELVAAGFDMSKVYLVDGNTADYSKDFDPGTLENAQGTIPGAFPSKEFQDRLATVDDALTSYAYGPESYDGTILAALAAVKGGATDGETIQKNMAAVSGANGGTECTTFKDCVAALATGDIIYKGQSAAGPFNADNDPSTAYIGVYKFDGDNKPVWTKAVFGEVK